MRLSVLFLVAVFLFSFTSAAIPENCDSSMVAYWKMDGDATDSYGDYDGDGDVFGGVIFKVGTAARLPGSNYITIADVESSVFSSSFSIEMWIMKDMAILNGSLFSKGNYNIDYVDYGATKRIVASVGDSVVSSESLSVFTPYFITLVWDSSAGKLRLYVNGAEVDEGDLPFSSDSSGDIHIGEGFTGYMDEVAIYDSALSDSKIASHYSLSNAGSDYCEVSGNSASSSTDTIFTVNGCNIELDDGTVINLGKNICYSGDDDGNHDGEYFCDEDGNLWNTLEENLGCAMGDGDFVTGSDFCCPPGMFCNQTGPITFQCAQRLENCVDQDNPSDCADAGCVWLDIDEECSDGLRDYECSYYDTEESCLEDKWNLGQIGIGTELCGTIMECNNGEVFSIPIDDCSCSWYEDADEGEKCQVKLIGVQMFFDPLSGQDRFECANSYNLGECVSGEQTISWSSTSKVLEGFDAATTVPNDCLEALNCNGGESVRLCGEPIIKLPGFSLFSLFSSLFIIGIYCFFKRD
jgi:hypothetical protein